MLRRVVVVFAWAAWAACAACAACGTEPLDRRERNEASERHVDQGRNIGDVDEDGIDDEDDVIDNEDDEIDDEHGTALRDLEPIDDDDGLEPLRDPGALGPYAVGVRTFEITDASRDRTFKVDVWFPAESGTGNEHSYEIEMPLVGTVSEIASPARKNATPLGREGGWPLVLFSHGYGGVRFQSPFITEHLASHGFVVASPDHPGNTLSDVAQLGSDNAAMQSSIDRPIDLALVLDHMLDASLNNEDIAIDATKIGATGHSFGAWTALELTRLDARIGAVFPMAPGFRQGATPDFVATLARPLLIIGGSVDDTCEFAENQQLPYDIAQTPKHLLQVIGAGHLDFSNLCDVAIARVFIDDGCDPTLIDPAVVHERVRHVSTAFALRFIEDDPRYDAFLDEDNVNAMGNVAYAREP